jgi:hypothetical protein
MDGIRGCIRKNRSKVKKMLVEKIIFYYINYLDADCQAFSNPPKLSGWIPISWQGIDARRTNGNESSILYIGKPVFGYFKHLSKPQLIAQIHLHS